MSAVLESMLRRDRWLVAASLLLVAGLSWYWLLAGAGMEMDVRAMTQQPGMSMGFTRATPWNPPYALLMFSMWWVMMVAMMLPAAAPVILLAAALNRRADPVAPPFGATSAFAAGYLLAWGGFSLAAVLIQWGLEHSGLITTMMASADKRFSGAVLVLAGAWQFTPWKAACLRHCRSPVGFLTRHRRRGTTGALSMGARHGLYCIGCCWFLMTLLFVGGVMNLYWIIGLTIYVGVEKLLPGGHAAARVMGAVLIAAGLTALG